MREAYKKGSTDINCCKQRNDSEDYDNTRKWNKKMLRKNKRDSINRGQNEFSEEKTTT